MSLTNKIRRELSFKLAAMALSKHFTTYKAAVAELNKQFAAVHMDYVEALLPEVVRSRWPDLIQEGVLKPASGMSSTLKIGLTSEDGTPTYETTSIGHFTSPRKSPCDDVDALCKVIGEVCGESVVVNHHQSSHLYVKFRPRFSTALPQIDYAGEIYLHMLHPSQVSTLTTPQRVRLEALAPLTEQAATITKGWLELVVSGLQYREEVYDLLLTCKTRKQLEDVFPEAAKLLAPVAPKRNEVVPAELAANVRRRLVEGVPS